ncbi:DUF1127 domain-containing protein [Humitalea sp. 24SJ18S-53]|uniref:DUF1127 domain-containing protein n=1 Tax=Humitalea sp. 24SJ18S-53 TaxID=3422307 RepID=UPI003D677A69
MDARMNQAELAGMAPFTRPRDAVLVDELRAAVAHAQDHAIARGVATVGRAVMAVVARIAAIPARMEMEAELRGMTDRELADIGLTRGQIGSVLGR